MEDVGTVLGVSTEQPSKYQRGSSVFGVALIATSYWGHLLLGQVKGQTIGSGTSGRVGRTHEPDVICIGAMLFVLTLIRIYHVPS